MYFRLVCLGLISWLLMFSVALSNDLCLIKIDSYEALETVRNNVEYAHGKIDDGFIAELDETQITELRTARIPVELISKDVILDRHYLISKIHLQISRTALYFEPKVSKNNDHLVEMSSDNIDILRKDGYMTIKLEDLQTPFFYHPPAVSMPALIESPFDSLADLVSQDSIYAYDTRLEDFQTRFIYADSIYSARDWLIAKFESFGYTNVTTQYFDYNGRSCYNVICVKPGTTEADKLVVVGGHYDSINFDDPENGMTYAPGADDNASGTTTVLELARVLSLVETKKSYMFCAFAAEEVGLVGSYYVAQDLYYGSTYDVECMINFDMVGFTADEYDNVHLMSGNNSTYAMVMEAAAERVTTLIPQYVGQAGNSDHASFDNFGFLVGYGAEGDFNTLGWHTDLDISSRLDFPYFEQVVRMGAAALGHIDNAAHPTPIENLYDIGDGQSLRIVWGDCDPLYYYVILYGTSSGIYTDTIEILSVPPCEYDITGLIEGQDYYITVAGINPEGYGPLMAYEVSGASFVNPQAPTGLTADMDYMQISLSWNDNFELDLNHYKLLHRPVDGFWVVLEDNITDLYYDDMTAEGHVEYEYMVLAVDDDLNESDSSGVVSAIAATFDLPFLFVDETSSSGTINPSETKQAELYDSILFADYEYGKYYVEGENDPLPRSISGQYNSIIWIDDDLSIQLFESSKDSVEWFLNYNTNFCLAGWQAIYWMTGADPLPAGHFIRDNFDIYQVTENAGFDFIGAFGQNGWPDLQTSNDNIFSGFLPNIVKFSVLGGGEVIYTFNSNTDDPNFEGEPCAVLYNTGSGKMIALGFPIYHLTTESAIALMSKIMETFGVEIVLLNGDVNNDGVINIMDITYFISYIYKGGPPPPILNQADANSNCMLALLDVTYLISYLYHGGPEPGPGCVE